MEKILKIKKLKQSLNIGKYEINSPTSEINYTLEEIEKNFEYLVRNEVQRFYDNPTNKDKKYNLVLITDDELNKLEKEAKQ